MKILIDMNLSPSWVAVFQHEDWEAVHWSTVGKPTAPDSKILEWAAANNCLLFTHDLDFGVLLASKSRTGPSVIQLRSHETSPGKMASVVVRTIRQIEELKMHVLVTVEPARSRIRVLPLP